MLIIPDTLESDRRTQGSRPSRAKLMTSYLRNKIKIKGLEKEFKWQSTFLVSMRS
jgi:hypothetical protein